MRPVVRPDGPPVHVDAIQMPSSLSYSLVCLHYERHVFELELSLASELDRLHFRLPDWVPGSYRIRDYARHIVSISATVNGADARLEKDGKSRWCLETATGEVRIRYQVYALDRSVRGAYLDTEGWFFQGVCVFLGCEEAQHAEHRVVVQEAAIADRWSLATTLPSLAEPAATGRAFRADSYAELIDHPFLAGELERYRFTVADVPHELVLAGHCELDADVVLRDLQAICEAHVRCFGELPAIDQYRFLTRVEGESAGGLEHRNSCVLAVPRRQLSRAAERADYLDFLSLVSHEYFHMWLVKRIRPRVLAEARLDREVHTRTLWVFEGITSYYDELALLRAGVVDTEEYLQRLSQLFSRVQRGAGRLRQSLAEASFDTWTRFYQQDENAPNALVNYYSKGAITALALDLVLRQRSEQGSVSLDTVMRALWQRHGAGEPLAEDGFEALACELAGQDLTLFFDQAIRGCEDLPMDQYLAAQGVCMRWHAVDRSPPWLGCTFERGCNRIAVVYEDSPAQRAGVTPGDELLAWNGVRFDASEEVRFRCESGAGAVVQLALFRNDELLLKNMILGAPRRSACALKTKPGFEHLRDQWLLGHA